MVMFDKEPFLIAEIGVNYYDIAQKEGLSPLEAALLMVEKAHESGADAVKFQTYKASSLATPKAPAYWDLTQEETLSQYDLFLKYDHFQPSDYEKIASFCQKIGILFSSTPFDFEAVEFLDPLVSFFKIASSDLTNFPLIEKMAQKGKPLLLSTGASTLLEIQKTLECIRQWNQAPLVLMHCILEYPTPDEHANLFSIPFLKETFPKYLIGYSDHTVPQADMHLLTTAYLLGANVIEKHFTLDKTLHGNDHYHAAAPEDFQRFRQEIKKLTPLLGVRDKKVFPYEERARAFARRSIVAKKDLPKGASLSLEDLDFKRPGTGLSPDNLSLILGKKMKQPLQKDDLILLDMVEP